MNFQRILVPVAGTAADDEALRMACFLGRKNKAKIWVVYIIILKRSLPVDAEVDTEIKKGESILDHMETIAEQVDYPIETELLQSREAGPIIIDEAVDHSVDMIMMGIKYKRRLGQFSLGSVVPYVLKNAPCRVMLYQQ
jgi:nucleotide-binding universal stress UspA family protein